MLMNEIIRAPCELPKSVQGHIVRREAMLSEQGNAVETWTGGSYEIDDISNNVRKLERPLAGRSGSNMTGLNAFQDSRTATRTPAT